MIPCVVDTNVPIVANGRVDLADGGRSPSIACRIASVEFLTELLVEGVIFLDMDGAIQAEYAKYLHAKGQPGVGDRFYQAVIHSAPHLITRVHLPKREDGEYADLPQALIDAKFDPSDRKFAALAKREALTVVNATDSDWVEQRVLLEENRIRVQFLCGGDKTAWFAP